MTTRTRGTKLTVWLDDAELDMLEELTSRTGLDKSNLIRQLVRREHASTSPTPKKKTRSR